MSFVHQVDACLCALTCAQVRSVLLMPQVRAGFICQESNSENKLPRRVNALRQKRDLFREEPLSTVLSDSALPRRNIVGVLMGAGARRKDAVIVLSSRVSGIAVKLVHNSRSCRGSVYSCPRGLSLLSLPQTVRNVFIERLADYILVKSTFGFSLAWDGSSGVYLKMTEAHKGRPCGLCGNYNDDGSDDLSSSRGIVSDDIAEFGNSWAVDLPQERPCPEVDDDFPGPCSSESDMDDAIEKCSALLFFPFISCHENIDPNPFVASCVSDISDDQETFCRTLVEYTRACSHVGYPVREWRDSFPTCSDGCEDSFVHRDCISCCPPTCTFEKECLGTNLHCLDGCYCPDGLILQNGTCIAVSQCPCVYHAECTVMGDAHVTTFDGRIFMHMGSCQYVLVKSRGSTKFTVTLQYTGCGESQEHSCIHSVALVVDEDVNRQVTLTREGEVVIGATMAVNLPYSDDMVNVRRLTSMFVGLRSVFGLRFQYDWQGGRIYLQLDSTWMGSTLGLCGTLNGNLRDDFLPVNIPIIDPCEMNQQNVFYSARCDVLLEDVFAPCHAYVSPSMYHQQCRYQACRCGTCGKTCQSISSGEVCDGDCAEGCSCSEGTFYDHARQRCVQLLCTNGRMECVPEEREPERGDCPNGKVYYSCTGQSGRGPSGVGVACELTCRNLMLNLTCPPMTPCVPGCGCPAGLVAHNGECYYPENCPCAWLGLEYLPGETVDTPCYRCVCHRGFFNCTYSPCPAVCTIYSDRHYHTFDGLEYDYVSDCQVYLVKSIGDTEVSIMAQNKDCYESGIVCMKYLLIYVGLTKIYFSDNSGKPSSSTVVGRGYEFQLWGAGYYTVVHFPAQDLTVLWDRKTTVHIRAGPQWKGQMSGLCGNFDMVTVNDMTTAGHMECESDFVVRRPCEGDLSRQPYAKRECGLLYSDVFAPCHNVVDVTWFYKNCLTDTCNCNRGGDCECLCTSIAAYAHKCCQNGVTVNWRSPTVCPYDCEYYNQELGEGPFTLSSAEQNDSACVFGANVSSGEVFPLLKTNAQPSTIFHFMITTGLYKDRASRLPAVSLESAERPNYFLCVTWNRGLRLEHWQPGEEFRRKATFIHHQGLWLPGQSSFELHSHKGVFLTLSHTHARAQNYDNTYTFKISSSFIIEGVILSPTPTPYMFVTRSNRTTAAPTAAPTTTTTTTPSTTATPSTSPSTTASTTIITTPLEADDLIGSPTTPTLPPTTRSSTLAITTSTETPTTPSPPTTEPPLVSTAPPTTTATPTTEPVTTVFTTVLSTTEVLTTPEPTTEPETTSPTTTVPPVTTTTVITTETTTSEPTTTMTTETTSVSTTTEEPSTTAAVPTTSEIMPSPSPSPETAGITTPPYSLRVDECSEYICFNGQLMLHNSSQHCRYNISQPQCNLLGTPIQTNTDPCCPLWQCPCRCSIISDLRVITFDGNNVALYDIGSYILVHLPREKIVGHIEKCPTSESVNYIRRPTPSGGTSGLCFKKLNITTQSYRIMVNRLDRKVSVNQITARLPLTRQNLHIDDTGTMYIINTPGGINIKWYHSTGIMVLQYTDVVMEIQLMTCGCPTVQWSGMLRTSQCFCMDGWWIRQRIQITSAEWETTAPPATAPNVSPENFCDKIWAGDLHYKEHECDFLAAYVAICYTHQICFSWRKSNFCPLKCPPGKEYKPCVNTCKTRTCQNRDYYEESTCSSIREECVCKSGTILHRADSAFCVTEDQCVCTDNDGAPRAPGEVWNGSLRGCCLFKCLENGSVVPVEPECSYEPAPLCEREGEYAVDSEVPSCENGDKLVIGYSALSCCPEYRCECDPLACQSVPAPICREDQFLVEVRGAHACCYSYMCVCESCIEPIPVCLPGEILAVDVNTTNHCCPQYHCVCDMSLCPEPSVSCAPGAVLVKRPVPDSCCPETHCECQCHNVTLPVCTAGEVRVEEPDPGGPCGCPLHHCKKAEVCLFQGVTILNPGQSMVQYFEGELCYTVQCLTHKDPSTGFYAMEVTTANCSEKCEPHQVYVPSSDPHVCCGSCKNSSCSYPRCAQMDVLSDFLEAFSLANLSTKVLLLQAGSSWVANCTRFDCMETAVGAVVLASGVVCPPFNDTECIQNGGVVQTYVDGCCKTCAGLGLLPFSVSPVTPTASTNCDTGKEDGKTCKRVAIRTTIRKDDCRSNAPVTVYSCDGKCPSATIFNFNINSHARFCKCCRENGLQNRIIQLYCTRNATTVDYYYQEPMDCSCQWN
ncbi:Otogelin-like protein [Labeo rohita]|uniref:Otogelin-like protein n=1 Tax=Labeo rohita TaxID=84645 RepID=A0ABQ8LRU4_LABRO|nr:Otogelin-like protein [Labeo rohita]